MNQKVSRPVFLNLFKIKFPITAVTSILHRITGVLLFLYLPVIMWLMHYSKSSYSHFINLVTLFESKPLWFFLLFAVFVFVFVFHLLCGIKHLLTDVGIGKSLRVSQVKSWVVLIATVLISILILVYF